MMPNIRNIVCGLIIVCGGQLALAAKETAVISVSFEHAGDQVTIAHHDSAISLSCASPQFFFKDGLLLEPVAPNAVTGRLPRDCKVQYAPLPLPDGQLEVHVFFRWDQESRLLHKWARFRVTGTEKPYTLMETVLEELDLSGEEASITGAPPQSYPAFWKGFFAGIAHPVASTRLENERLILAHRPGITLAPEQWYESRKAVVGVTEPGEEWTAFAAYVEANRPTPGGLHFNYNSWWTSSVPFTEDEILGLMQAFHDNLYVKHGVSLDTFAIDMGWSDDKSIWGIDAELFPDGFTRISKAAEAMGVHLGLWVSPSSHYEQALDAHWAQEQGYETQIVPIGKDGRRIMCLGGANYASAYREQLVDMVTKYGIRHIKLDGYWPKCEETSHGHEAGDYSSEAIAEGVLGLFQGVRDAAPDTWLETTCFGYNPSPWWLFHVNSVIGTYGDDAPHGRSPSPFYRESYTTARDFFNLQGAARMPISSTVQEVLGVIHQSDEDFMNDAVTVLLRGHALTPLYFNPKYMNERRWSALAGTITWARNNVDLLADAKAILPATWRNEGTPVFANDADMPREPYGYAHWSAERGLVLLRNPWIQPATIPVTVHCAGPVTAVSLYPEPRRYSEDLQSGTAFDVLLAPCETMVLDIGRHPDAQMLPAADAQVCNQLAVAVKEKKVTRVDYDFNGSRIGKDYTCLIDDTARAARIELAAAIASHAERTQLLVLLEGPKTPAAPRGQLTVDGTKIPLTLVSSDNGFAASSIPGVEYWAFYGADIPAGEHAIALTLETAAYCERVSVWTMATRPGDADVTYPNALPTPETLYLDATTLLAVTDIESIATQVEEPAPVIRIDGVYLDAVEPESVDQGWRELQRNLSVWERPLSIGGERFTRGLGTHAPSTIVYALDGTYSRFQAAVGQDDEVNGTVTFEVLVDGVSRWRSGVMRRGDAAKTVDIDISGAKKIELIVGDAGDNIMADHANWADAKLLQ